MIMIMMTTTTKIIKLVIFSNLYKPAFGPRLQITPILDLDFETDVFAAAVTRPLQHPAHEQWAFATAQTAPVALRNSLCRNLRTNGIDNIVKYT
jgi:hypothetical protein